MIQVFQDCDEDGGWPLEVVGEDGLVREVYLQPGEMVLYEGAVLPGRQLTCGCRGTVAAWAADEVQGKSLWQHFQPLQTSTNKGRR